MSTQETTANSDKLSRGEFWNFTISMAIVGGLFVFLLYLLFQPAIQVEAGTVVDKQYQAEQMEMVCIFRGPCNASMAPEEWHLIVEGENGFRVTKKSTIVVPQHVYDTYQVGDTYPMK